MILLDFAEGLKEASAQTIIVAKNGVGIYCEFSNIKLI